MFDSSSDDEDFAEPPALVHRHPRVFRQRINFDLHGIDNDCRFRLKDLNIDFLLNQLHPILSHKTKSNMALSSRQQLLVALRFLATGDNLRTIGDAHGIHKSTVSRCVRRVVTAINRIFYFDYVKWPEDEEELHNMKTDFRNIVGGGIPAVFGCVDGTHVELKRPSSNEVQYLNRHGNHSLNVMLICGPHLEFYYANPKWPGSVSDARVFRRSGLRSTLENGWRPCPNGVLLGDSIYPCTNYLIPPVGNPQTEQEKRFNVAHKKTRRLIECSIGLLKQRFRCLSHQMAMAPHHVADIVMCCVTLHNMLIDTRGTPDLEIFDFAMVDDEENLVPYNVDNPRRAQLISLF